jgi:hypothetical protein
MIDAVPPGASQALSSQLATQSVDADRAQVAATAQAQQNTQRNTEAQNQVGPPKVNTGLTGEAPANTSTPPGSNLDIQA